MKERNSSTTIPAWGSWVIGLTLGSILAAYLILSGTLYRIADSSSQIVSGLGGLLILALLALLYFLPSFIGHHSPRSAAITVANFVFGWTVIGWFAVLIWALAEHGSAKTKQQPSPPHIP